MARPDSERAKDTQPDNLYTLTDQTNYVSKAKIITIFLACATVDFVALMDQTTLAASLLIISRSLGGGSEMAWISGSFFMYPRQDLWQDGIFADRSSTSTSFQLVYGRLSDIWSRKSILLTGLAIFFIGSLAASLAQSTTKLIIFRAITGVGGGGLMTVAQAIVSDVVTLRERGKYQGILDAVVAIANGIGPIIGASLSSKSEQSWRWIFRLNHFLSVLTCGIIVFFMPLKRVEGDWKEKIKQIDFPGILLALGGSALVALGLEWGGSDYPWNSVHVVTTLALGCLVSVIFLLWQWKGARIPLIPLRMFRTLLVNGACLTMFINGWNFLVQVYYIPTFFQLAYRYSAIESASLLLPITLMQTLSSTFSGLIIHWRGRYRESILGCWAIWAVGLGLFSTLDQSSSLRNQIGYGLLIGFGLGQTLQPSLVAVQAGVRRADMAVVTSTRNFIRNLGGTLGLAISGTILNNILSSGLTAEGFSSSQVALALSGPSQFLSSYGIKADTDLVDAYRHGFRVIFIICAALASLATVLAFFMMPQVELNREDDKILEEEGLKGSEKDEKMGKQEAC